MVPRLTKSYEASSQPIASIRSSVLSVVVGALEATGVSTDHLLAQHGLSRLTLDDPYNPVSLKNYVAFFEDAARMSSQPMLGIRLGNAIKAEDLGPVGVLYTMMQTLRSAIVRFSHFFPALQGSTKLGLSVRGDATWLEYQIEDQTIWPRRQDTEFTLALICALTRSRLGRGWAPEEIHFEHSAPTNGRDMAHFFGAVIRFDQPINRMLIRTEDLDLPFASANPAAIAIIEQHLNDLIGDGVVPAFEDAVLQAIMRCMKRGEVTLELVASRLGIGPRTLQRRLAATGRTFREIVQQQRHGTATVLLKDERIALGVVAGNLGYADTATMSRAFKTWTGQSPRAYSKKNRREAR
ncbi:AraC-like transcriptional regulator QhpR [Mesorhizobium japonicum]|nr:AraC family transcriptional regulator [Mesorhizobium japonicum]